MNTKRHSLRKKEWAGDGGEPTLFVCQNFGDGCGDGFGREQPEILRDLRAQLALRPELPASSGKSSGKKKSAASLPP